ncbi:unnamed protein product [Larinioides sclopetarius]|uniref:Uncharacterized protein n=1 Tax=Larinioides sclopetarius TaxID=280406 RepID=A0AAV2B9W6_9ARAC
MVKGMKKKRKICLTHTYKRYCSVIRQDRMHTLNHLIEPDVEYLWTAVDWKDIEEKFISLKIPSSVITRWAWNC